MGKRNKMVQRMVRLSYALDEKDPELSPEESMRRAWQTVNRVRLAAERKAGRRRRGNRR